MRVHDFMTARHGLIAAAALALVGLGVIGAGAAWRAAVQPELSAAEEPCDCKAGIRAEKLRSRRDKLPVELP